MTSELKILLKKLNPICRRALEGAASLCVSQTHYNVELEHLLTKLVDLPNTDIQRVLRYYDVNTPVLLAELGRATETFKRGNSRTPAMSPQILLLLKEAWQRSTLLFGGDSVRSAAVLLALLDDDPLRDTVLESCPSLAKIPRESLRRDIQELVAGSSEDGLPAAAPPEPEVKTAPDKRKATTSTPAMDQYTIDVTAQARSGKIDPIRGRDVEIRQVIDILTRRRQNNPILVGEAGVGKTAVVEGFAQRVVNGEVPASLREISVRILDLGLLQAGAGIKGEFEERLKSVIKEVEGSAQAVILFIDEAHTLIGAGGSAGQGDAANLLKPALARGELRTIAATTWGEYKKYIEKDPALARRFQLVKVEEPSEEAAIDMLRGVGAKLEQYHKVRIPDEAVREAVRLSHRYLPERRLPDKAVSVLDTACARVALARDGTPPAIEDIERKMQSIESEERVLRREQDAGVDHTDAIAKLKSRMETLGLDKEKLVALWKKESDIVSEIHRLEAELDEKRRPDQRSSPGEISDLGRRILKLKTEHEEVQEAEPLVPFCVDSRVIAAVVSGWTGVPIGSMLTDEINAILTLKERMEERVVGQSHALDAICRRISTSKAELEDPEKPKGVFLLVGPSGVGKTETALVLADLLYGGARNVITVNMSEFQEAHSVATLKGAPPGYVGYGKGGVLTEAVRRRPYSVVLLDEMEKAHSDVAEIFFQVFDKGMLEDGEGVPVDFRNTVILLTSNVGSETIVQACESADGRPERDPLVEALRPELQRHFKTAFLGRLVVVPYYPLADEQIRRIVKLKLAKIQERFAQNHMADLAIDQTLIDAISARCTEVDSGARNIDQILSQTLLPELSTELLVRMASDQPFSRVEVTLRESGDFAYSIQ